MSISRHLVDPDLLGFLEIMPELRYSAETLAQMRGMEFAAPEIENPEAVERWQESAPGPDGAPDISLIVYRPATRSEDLLPCIFHIHGGGYVSGSASGMEPQHRAVAETLGCIVTTVEYRLAPETPYPGPLEDCYAGLRWVHANAACLGVDTGRIGVMGESAGGGLAAGLALLVRDRGEFAFSFQHLYCPMLDDRTAVLSDTNPFAGEFIWTRESNTFGWRSYLGTEPGGEDVSPYAAPARATDLVGLPPTFIGISTLDLFVDEDIAYAARLMRAGVPTELKVYPGGFHGFNMLCETAPVSIRANRERMDALRRALEASANVAPA